MEKNQTIEYLNPNYCLPDLLGIKRGLRNNRSVYDGYQRGWGLEFGGLRDKILGDSLYLDACSAAEGRTIMSEKNRMTVTVRFSERSVLFL